MYVARTDGQPPTEADIAAVVGILNRGVRTILRYGIELGYPNQIYVISVPSNIAGVTAKELNNAGYKFGYDESFS